MRELCDRLSKSPDAQAATEGLACLSSAAEAEGRLREHLSLYRRYTPRLMAGAASVYAALDSGFVDAWFLDRSDEAASRLDSLLATKPADKTPDVAYYRVAEYYAYAHKPQKARAVIARLDAENVSDTATRRLTSSDRHQALGEIAIAEGKFEVAIHEFQAADTSYDGAPIACGSCIAPRLARAYDLAGRPDDAIREFENYLNSTYARRGTTTDPQYLAGSYKRLAELYEAKGDRAKAASNYAKFIELWKNADPELQPKVQEAKRRFARLGAEGR